MRRIQQGRWSIGSPDSEPDRYADETPHEVSLSAYWMDTAEISRIQFRQLMGYDPSLTPCEDRCPVENVTWFETILFCNARSKASRRDTVYQYSGLARNTDGRARLLSNLIIQPHADGFRLPSEAQWEVAARAGSITAWAWGSDSSYAQQYAWFQENANNQPHAIGSLRPNSWGFHDMHGNVSEWVWDWYDGYNMINTTDPLGASSGDQRTFRGGSWASSSKGLRLALRDGANPSYHSRELGFRCIRLSSN